MGKVVSVTPEMFNEVYKLLLDLKNPNISKEDWRNVVSHKWDSNNHFGYALMEQDRVVGFLGTIFSEREINGKIQKFCNVTSWIVKEEFRKDSILLVLQVMKLKDHTITAFTVTKPVSKIWITLGLTVLEPLYRIMFLPFKIISFSMAKKALSFIDNKSEVLQNLNDSESKIFNHHKDYKCRHLVFKNTLTEQYCYIIYNIAKTRGIRYCHIHYVSDISIFSDNINYIRWYLFKTSYALIALIPNRFLTKDANIIFSKKNVFSPPKILFKSNSVAPDEIDNLYSELILLNL